MMGSNKAGLLVLDLLTGVFDLGEPLFGQEAFLRNIESLLRKARTCGVPVCFARHCGPPGSVFEKGSPAATIHPRVAPAPDDTVVDKCHPDAFQESTLRDWLAARGVTRIVVCGFATEGCVDTTVRSAYARGYAAVLVTDCHTTARNAVLTAEQIIAHHNLILRRFATCVAVSDPYFADTFHPVGR